MKNSVSIIGLGYIGEPLARSLMLNGYSVGGSSRSAEKVAAFTQAGIKASLLNSPAIPDAELLKAETIVLNIPPFEGQLEWFQSWKWNTYCKIIFLSSTSVYQDVPSIVAEDSELKNSELTRQEKWIQERFQQFSILRLGGLLGGKRHPGKILSGKTHLKSPLHPVNLIHQDDVVGFIETVMQKNLFNQIFNVVSDEHSARKVFYQQYATKNGIALPAFDETDVSLGKLVSNQKMKEHYQLIHAKVS